MNERSFIFEADFKFHMRVRDEIKEQRIRQKAIEIVVKYGFDGLSMHKLAKAARISPATIYIYFKDREDLIFQISVEEELKMFEETLTGFDPDMSFENGLRIQWINRAKYFLKHPLQMQFMEQIRYSRFHERVFEAVKTDFVDKMRRFVKNAIEKKELTPLPIEVYWSVAYAPLYQLVKFHINKKGMHGKSFQLDDPTIDLALSVVLKGLKPI